MSADGLWYLPEGFREGARVSTSSADAAETTRQLLGRVQVNATSYGGAEAFVSALAETREAHARGAARAAEGRRNMAAADNQVAAHGEDVDAAAGQALGAASLRAQADQAIADGL